MTTDWQSIDLDVYDAISVVRGRDVLKDRERSRETGKNIIERIQNVVAKIRSNYIESSTLDDADQALLQQKYFRAKEWLEEIDTLYVELAREVARAINKGQPTIIVLASDYPPTSKYTEVLFTGESLERWLATNPKFGIRFSNAGEREAPPLSESLALSMTWATLLDAYMEIVVPYWRFALKDPDRSDSKGYFRGGDLEISELIKIIHPELDFHAVSTRTLHKHIKAAVTGIQAGWDFGEGFKPGEKKKAYVSLYGLAKSLVIACTQDEYLRKYKLEEPEQVAAFIDSEFFRHEDLSFEQMEKTLKTCWE